MKQLLVAAFLLTASTSYAELTDKIGFMERVCGNPYYQLVPPWQPEQCINDLCEDSGDACDENADCRREWKIPVHYTYSAATEVFYGAVTRQAIKNQLHLEHCAADAATPCSTDADCPGPDACDTYAGTCWADPLTACTVDADCSGGDLCDKREAVDFDALLDWISAPNQDINKVGRLMRVESTTLLCDSPEAPDAYDSGADIRSVLGY